MNYGQPRSQGCLLPALLSLRRAGRREPWERGSIMGAPHETVLVLHFGKYFAVLLAPILYSVQTRKKSLDTTVQRCCGLGGGVGHV